MRNLYRVLLLLGGVVVLAFREGEGFEGKVVEFYRLFVGKFPHEKLYVHTDREAYEVGDTVWFRVYGVHALTNVPGVPSRFVYVDLVDKRDSLVRRVKVGMRDTCFYGEMALPEGLQTDEYSLRAYTYNMQQLADGQVFQKRIEVRNLKDRRVRTKVEYRKRGKGYVADIRFEDPTGLPYAHAPIRWRVGKAKNIYSTNLQYTTREGELEIKVDSAGEVIWLSMENKAWADFERYIRVPAFAEDFDVQFLPEGGALLVGNRQRVAFKAVGSDGLPMEVTGTVYADSMALFDISSEHDGMGDFVLPVQRLRRFRAHVRAENGMEKWMDLPESSLEGWGLSVMRERGWVEYLVSRGEDAVKPERLYVMVYAGGRVIDIREVDGRTRGRIDSRLLPEGIVQVSLLDEEGRIYSQRLFFVKHDEERRLTCRADKRTFGRRDAVSLEIGLPDGEAGTFSLAVTDDGKVVVDDRRENIRSNLLLTSLLRGTIQNPGYYFREEGEEVDRHLDLVMLTHGWSRFDPGRIARGEFPKERYEIEMGQEIRGRVKNFWGKDLERAKVSLISNRGHLYTVETDSVGRFEIDSIVFPDSTRFVAQVLNVEGHRGVELEIERECLLMPRYEWMESVRKCGERAEEQEKWQADYYDENGQLVHVLKEVEVKRKRKNDWESVYEVFATYRMDSTRVEEMAKECDMFFQLLKMIPGVSIELVEGKDKIMRYGKPMRVLVNGYEEDIEILRLMPLDMVKGMMILDAYYASKMFRTPAMGENIWMNSKEREQMDMLLIEANPKFYPTMMEMRPGRVNLSTFSLLGYQEPAAFYVPKYEIDSVRNGTIPDRRRTVYWQPVVRVESGEKTRVHFYTADDAGTYTVVLEGVTRKGQVCRLRKKLKVEH